MLSTDSTPSPSSSYTEYIDSDSDSDQPPPSLAEVSPTAVNSVCKLCFRPAQAAETGLKLGPLYTFGSCQAHLYCLMFSSGLDQTGEEEEGIKGFLVEDIVREWRRGARLKCAYCKQKYATVGCVGKGCKKSYHLPCGIESGGLQQFFGDFPSHCETHRPVQTPLQKRDGSSRQECGVCLEDLEEKPSNLVLWTPCCQGWFHRTCVERMAEVAGCHFFKCPLCNNKSEFSEEMQQHGIYLPDQDAEWETGSAYDDQLERHGSCDADSCLCPHGDQHDEDDTPWEIVLCSCCGAQGIHVDCGKLATTRPSWKCSFCKEIVARLPKKPVSVFTRVKRGKCNPNKEFSRKILENLSFKVSNNNEVAIEVFKNKSDSNEEAVVTFLVTAVPDVDMPNSVKVRKYEHLERKVGLNNSYFQADKISSMTGSSPWQESASKKRKLSAKKVEIQGQPSIMSFFHKVVSPEEKGASSYPISDQLSQTDSPGSSASPSLRKVSNFSAIRSAVGTIKYENIYNQETLLKKEKRGFEFINVLDDDEIGEAGGKKSSVKKDNDDAKVIPHSTYSCDDCDMKTNYKSNLMRHLKDQHGGDKLVPTVNDVITSDDRDVPCFICKELVMLGDDYRCHLNIAHDIFDDNVDVEHSQKSVSDSVAKAEIPCHICNDLVMLGDDYQSHLLCVHDV